MRCSSSSKPVLACFSLSRCSAYWSPSSLPLRKSLSNSSIWASRSATRDLSWSTYEIAAVGSRIWAGVRAAFIVPSSMRRILSACRAMLGSCVTITIVLLSSLLILTK